MAERWTAGDKVLAADLNNSVVPTGAIEMWPMATPPTDWLLCDGAAISRSTYAALFAVIADLYGPGDGSTTFNLPNLKNRVPLGVDTAVKALLDDCESAWTAGGNVTASNDAAVYKVGTKSVKLAVAAGAGAGQILGYKAITSVSFAGKTIVGFWIRSSIALNAGDLKYQADDTAALASPLESIDIPAILANTWTKVYLTLATPSADTAIISHGIYQVVDKGAFDLYIDDIAVGENYEMGAAGGEKAHTLKIAELAAHTHSYSRGTGLAQSGSFAGIDNPGGSPNTGSAGGDLAHNNLPPYLTLNFIIKV